MDLFGNSRNSPLLTVLAQRVCALIIALIDYVRRDFPMAQDSFRKALLPMHRLVEEYLSEQSFADSSHHLREPATSFRTLPSMVHNFHPREHEQLMEMDRFACRRSITPPGDITPPRVWSNTPLGFTSTPFRPPTVRPRPEPFALINQFLMSVRTTADGSVAGVTDQYANDPVFRERILNELDELRSLITAQPVRTLGNLLERVEQAEITLSSLIQHLQMLQHTI